MSAQWVQWRWLQYHSWPLTLYRLSDSQATAGALRGDGCRLYERPETAPDSDYIRDLEQFLYTNQIAPSNAAFVVSAVEQQDEGPQVVWLKRNLFGSNAASDTGLANCGQNRLSQWPGHPAGRVYNVSRRSHHCGRGVCQAGRRAALPASHPANARGRCANGSGVSEAL